MSDIGRQTQRSSHRKSRLNRRRVAGILLSLTAVLGLLWFFSFQSANLQNSSWSSGYLLSGCLLFLAAFNLRKKLPALPFPGSSRMWMQWHIYVAFVSIAIFLAHVGMRVPNGGFERLLAALYVIVASSGIYGLYVTRTVPKKLTALNNEVLFEQIPQRRRQVTRHARQLILETARTTDVLARYYVNHLIGFFEKPRSFAYHLSPSLRRSRQLVSEIEGLDRYLSETQRTASRHLTRLVREKEDLDYHRALQGRLKVWLFLHVGLTYGLVFASMLHGIMAHAFGGGLR